MTSKFDDIRKNTDKDKKKVLIVEDDINICDLIKDFLGKKYLLTFESSGRKVISKAMSLKPDVILLDIRIPDMNGIEVLKLIKKRTIVKDIPVIMMTALSDKPTVIECAKYGATDYIIKPFDLNNLLEKIETNSKK